MKNKIMILVLVFLLILTACNGNANSDGVVASSDANTQTDSTANNTNETPDSNETDEALYQQWEDLKEALVFLYTFDNTEAEEEYRQRWMEFLDDLEAANLPMLEEEIFQWVLEETSRHNRELGEAAEKDILQWAEDNLFPSTEYHMVIDVETISYTTHNRNDVGYDEARYTHLVTYELSFDKTNSLAALACINESLKYQYLLRNEDYMLPQAPESIYDYYRYEISNNQIYSSVYESGTIYENNISNSGINIEIGDTDVSITSFNGAQIANYGIEYVEVFSELLDTFVEKLFAGRIMGRINLDPDRGVTKRMDLNPFYSALSSITGEPLSPNTEAGASIRLFTSEGRIRFVVQDGIFNLAQKLVLGTEAFVSVVGEEIDRESFTITIQA